MYGWYGDPPPWHMICTAPIRIMALSLPCPIKGWILQPAPSPIHIHYKYTNNTENYKYKYKYNKNTRYKQYHDQLSHQKLGVTNLARRRGVPNLVSANMSATMGATAMACSTQGWAGIPVSRDSREYKPQISLPVAFCNFPSRSREKEVLGIKTGNTIITFSFADGWSRHKNK